MRYGAAGRIEALSRRRESVGSLRTTNLPSSVPKETTSGRPEGKRPGTSTNTRRSVARNQLSRDADPPRGQMGDELVCAYRPLQARNTTAPNNSPWAENSATAQRTETLHYSPFQLSKETQVGIKRTVRSECLSKKKLTLRKGGKGMHKRGWGGEG